MGVIMLRLVKIENDNQSLKLLYKYQKCCNPNWKQNYIFSCRLKGVYPILQGSLTDYEYFKIIRANTQEEFSSLEFILMDNDTILGSIYVIMVNCNIADISVFILPEYRRNGFAKMAIGLAEDILFSDANILFATIRDLTKDKVSSHIALELGYAYEEKTDTFVKGNPNVNLEALIKR